MFLTLMMRLFMAKDSEQQNKEDKEFHIDKCYIIYLISQLLICYQARNYIKFNFTNMQGQNWMALREPIWIHKNNQFMKGIIKQITGDFISCLLQSGDVIKVKKINIFHRNALPTDTTRTDLLESDIINEPEILNTIKSRFQEHKIYTFVESTLLALNPYQIIPTLYTQTQKDHYINKIIDNHESIKQYEPHIYSITAAMLQAMLLDRKDQAIIISGESGAGKTQANKECLRFIAHFFKNKNVLQEESKIEKSIILANPILQAFGNSRTIRNNNSSRFGKYLSLYVDKNNQIKHAQIYNYLLEKSRIISRSFEEQNFHIFYEYLIETSKADKLKYFLLDDTNKEMTFQDFTYTRNEQIPEYKRHPDVQFNQVKESLKILPDEASYDYVCRILSAILYLGNLEPYEDEGEEKCTILPDAQFEAVCKLLQISSNHLYQSLTSYSIKIGGDDLIKSFGKRQVQQLIHSLSKTLYQKLFQWMINEINISTSSQIDKSELCSLGFLDIYGFEVLNNNSLEQLFINYTNERLHQIYLKKIFKIEQQNFKSQGLLQKFKQVQFQDNVKVLDLIDFNNLSIFNLLDDWCGVASPDEASFITKIRYNHKKHQKFPPSNLNLLSSLFLIRHTPQDIQYSVSGFREKNKDLLRQEIKITMRSSKLPILTDMFTENLLDISVDPKAHKVRKFLSSKFRKEMNSLVDDILEKSELHFIRCMKSNPQKKPMKINEEVLFSQIKYLGILDTIKIKKMGYCIKVKYEDIDRRFPWLVRNPYYEPAQVNKIKQSLAQFLPRFTEEEFLYGKTKIFFKDYAYGVLLKKYIKHYNYLNEQCHKITSVFVHHHYVTKKQKKKERISLINRYFLGFLEQKKKDRMIYNIIRIQNSIRKYFVHLAKEKKKESIQIIQAYIKRTIDVQKRLKILRGLDKVVKFMRSVLIRRKFEKQIITRQIIFNNVIENAWNIIKMERIKILQKYFKSYNLQSHQRINIAVAQRNSFNVMKQKKFNKLQTYLMGFNTCLQHLNYLNTVIKGQNLIRSWMIRRRYLKLKKSTIIIQTAWRTYYFKKKGAKALFSQTYKFYQDKVKNQNRVLSQYLYQIEDSENCETIDLLAKDYLSKFKEKMSILYFLIDFETFIDLELTYPENSWIINYYQLIKQSYEHDTPLQYIEVGESSTFAATTSKLYVWGLNNEYKTLDNITQIKTKLPYENISVEKNSIRLNCGETSQQKTAKTYSTINKKYQVDAGKIYEKLSDQLKLMKIGQRERVIEVSCGSSHTILRTTGKKIYTFGSGKKGQLGHGNTNSEEVPKIIKFFEQMKTYSPLQVAASFNSSIVLLSNHKVYWFGTNGTIKMCLTPTIMNLKNKSQFFGTNQHCIVRLIPSWSRSMSLIGVSILCFNGKMMNNASLRNKTVDLLISKWHQKDIKRINPPYVQSLCDHLEQCHVKLPKMKVNIQPESKKILKEMEDKVKNMEHEKMMEISFANTQRNSLFK